MVFYLISCFIGQKWIEADVMAEKRKPTESNEIIDDGENSCVLCCSSISHSMHAF